VTLQATNRRAAFPCCSTRSPSLASPKDPDGARTGT